LFVNHTTLRHAALGVIAILAVMLMLEASGSAGDRNGAKMAASL
jgi:hypothetical protein